MDDEEIVHDVHEHNEAAPGLSSPQLKELLQAILTP